MAAVLRSLGCGFGSCGPAFDPANHSSASAPAALSPHIFAQDDSRALAPLAPPEPSSPWVCRFCVASFNCLPSFDLHLASVHQCTPASYPTLLRHALGQAFPRPADPRVLRAVLARYRPALVSVLAAPPVPCAVCTTLPDDPCQVRDLRSPLFHLPSLHHLLSAAAYLQRYRSRLPEALPSTFVGLSMSDLDSHSVPVPTDVVSQPASASPDRWLLYLRTPEAKTSWQAAATSSTSPLLAHLCSHCCDALQLPRCTLPGRALANDNLHIPLPTSLRDLTPAELMFLARGHTLCRLRALPARGPPEARQRALFGNVVSFPQDSAGVVRSLPHSPAALPEFLHVFFPPEGVTALRTCPEFLVRRARVQAGLEWLHTHNPYYADVVLDPKTLAELPIEGVPDVLLRTAQPLPDGLLGPDAGPAQATMDAGLPSASTPGTLHSLSAAVLDVEGESTHPLTLWQP